MKTKKSWRHRGAMLLVFLFTSLSASVAGAQTSQPTIVERKTLTAEQKGELQLAAARTNPLELRQFLKKVAKGTDLHYHLGGGVYAESFIRAAAEDGLCVDTKELALVKCDTDEAPEPSVVPAGDAYKNQSLYDQLVDSFSMRRFVPSAGVSGHDRFFATFVKFRALASAHDGEWVDEVAGRAASQNVQYMELMETPDFALARKLSQEIPWNDDLKVLRDNLLKHKLRENVRTAVAFFQGIEKKRRELEKCGASGAAEACKVQVRFLCQVLRGLPKETVFAQTLLCFEAAAADPETIAGLNLVMSEDGRIAMQDYAQHMRMVKYLHEIYPSVRITLHAGELAYELVPPEGLCCHVRLAVEAGAERIGHGTDVMFEDRPHELLQEMAAKHVMVEVNLTSGDLILGVSGKDHPLPLYRR
jgi:adenosine deaminase